MKIRYILGLFICLSIFASCKKDFLQRDPGVDLALDSVFADPVLAGRFADRTYNFRIDDYGRLQAAGQPSQISTGEFTDESVGGSLRPGLTEMYKADWLSPNAIDVSATTSTSRGLTPYVKLYSGIRNANVALVNLDKVPWAKEPKLSANLVKAQQLWLRAYFYYEFAKRWGGAVLLDKPLGVNDNPDLPRSTFAETMAFIEKDLDEAEKLFSNTTLTDPASGSIIYNPNVGWNPSFVINPTGSVTGDVSNNNGRADIASTRALRSRVLLLAASPRDNSSNDLSKWAKAAAAAKSLIDMGKYALQPRYQDILEVATSPEHIMIQIRGPRLGFGSNFFGNYVISKGYGGAGNGLNPTQNHVDLYEMSNGKRITDGGTGITYNPASPYANRDPRLNHNVLVNGRAWKGRTIETFREPTAATPYGRDAGTEITIFTVTGYYSRKMWPEALTGNVTTTALLHYIYFRYGEILLNYAEAINEASTAGFTQAIPFLDQLRVRAGMPTVSATMAIRGTTINQSTMRDFIHNERAVELAFEDHRWWDILRWKKGPQIVAQPMIGMDVLKTGATFKYTPFTLADSYMKIFKDYMHYYPIPQSEIDKSRGVMKQNPGWAK